MKEWCLEHYWLTLVIILAIISAVTEIVSDVCKVISDKIKYKNVVEGDSEIKISEEEE